MAPDTLPAAYRERSWTREALSELQRRTRPFTRTALGFMFRPKAFVRAWTAGKHFAINPLSFLATSTAAITAADSAMQQLVGGAERHTLLESVALAVAPPIYYTELGIVAHLVLRLLGSHRRAESSVAMALFAGGSATVLVQLALHGVQVVLPRLGVGSDALDWVTAALSSLAFFAFFMPFSASMSELHRARGWRLVLANLVALLVSGVACSAVPLPTFSLVVRLVQDSRWAPSIFLRF